MNNIGKKPLLLALILYLTLIFSVLLGLIFQDPKAIPLGLLLFPGMLLAWQNPRLGLLALLIYLPLGNTVTFSWAKVFMVKGNVIAYTNSYPLYKIAKDAFYLPALAKILLRTNTFRQLRPKVQPLFMAVVILTLAVLLTFFLVNLPDNSDNSWFRGLIGIKIILGYIPLVLCGYYLVKEPKDLWMVSRLLIILILICCSLCLVQYFLLKQGICPRNFILNETAPNRLLERFYPDISGKVTLKAQCFVGGGVLYNPGRGLIRLPGTFSDPWQWGWFLISSSFITYAASFSDPSPRWRLLGLVSMAFLILVTLLSGQRIAILLVPIFYLILFFLTQKYNKWLLFKMIIIASISGIAFTQIIFLQEIWHNLVDRWQYSPPLDFMLNQFNWLIDYRLSLFGQGLGSASSAVRTFVSEDAPTRVLETYYVKLLYEIGVVGFLAFMSVVTTLTILTFKARISLKNPSLKNWATCIWIFIIFISFNSYYYPLTVEPVSIYYWLLAGILLKLPEIEA